ncbi:MAG: biopolymer transporter ExbD [Sphaerochaetaceae bacterium]
MQRRKNNFSSSMSDIAFLLLLFFLILLIVSPQLFDNTDLPESNQGAQTSIEGPSLFIDSMGKIYLEGRPIDFEEIPLGAKVAIYSAEATSYGAIAPLIEYLRQNSVKTIQCLVRPNNE